MSEKESKRVDVRALRRLLGWGMGALIAVGTVILSGYDESRVRGTGSVLAALFAPSADGPSRAQLMAKLVETESEARRVADTVRALTIDREALSARIAALERNLGDLTGAISKGAARDVPAPSPAEATARGDKSDTPAPKPAPPLWAMMPGTSAIASGSSAPPSGDASPLRFPHPAPLALIESYASSGSQPAARPSTATKENGANAPDAISAGRAAASKTEYALDIAVASNVNALRARWEAARSQHPILLQGLRPLIAVRDSASRPGTAELHLVAGPVANASDAARLCAALIATGSPCQTAVFDGQRLALR
jgi:hypothetical protein